MQNIFKDLRIQRGKTLEDFSKEIGIGIATLNRLELFKCKNIQAKTLHKFVRYVNKEGTEIENIYLKQREEYLKNEVNI